MKRFFYISLLLTLFACQEDEGEQPITTIDNFDRQAMLTHWADQIIIPAYTAFAEKTGTLKAAGEAFATTPSLSNYRTLTQNWENAYLAFQEVSMFEIGKAEELRFTNNLNVYPTNVQGLQDNIMSGDYNLELPSQVAMQGFPALDYLLYGVGDEEQEVLNFYQNDTSVNEYLAYLKALVSRIDLLSNEVLADWKGDYRNTFLNNQGNTALSSVDKLVNDYIFYYEKHLRAGKIGIPAGVFSGDYLSTNVEAFYRKDLSKALFNRALDAVQNFFNGVAYDGSMEGQSMKDYLEYLEVEKNEKNLATVINEQFEATRNTANDLLDIFSEQIETDNVKMLETYDQLQLNVVHMKVDMLQAFNVNVDYVDADGD